MTISTTLLGQLSAQVMESIEERFDEPFEIRTCAIVVEIDSPKAGQLIAKCSDDRPWVLSAFLAEAIDAIDSMRTELQREDEHE